MSPATAIKPLKNHRHDTGWQASLSLTYAMAENKTVLLKQAHRGPLFVQKSFYPEGPETCHTYIIHPPGGVVGGDTLTIALGVNQDAHVVVTTPAAAKFYRSTGHRAVQANQIAVASGAVLEWLPQETIIYDQSDVQMTTKVELAGDAGFIGWEIICLGLPACGRPFTRGSLVHRFEINRHQKPVYNESLRIYPGDPALDAAWGLAGRPVIGTMVATTEAPHAVEAIRKQMAHMPYEGYFTTTSLRQVVVSRFLGEDVYTGLTLFRQVWEILRPLLTGKKPCPPRIWAT